MVDVFGEANLSENTLSVNIYANTAANILSFGVKLTYSASDVSVTSVERNNTTWYLGNASTTYPYIAPDSSVQGQVTIIGGLLDTENPTRGVTGHRILLGTVNFNRLNVSAPSLSLTYARSAPHKNFVSTDGTVYDDASQGVEFSITFIAAPTVTTTAISSITANSASSGGNVTADGGASVTARGVCWSTSANPTTSNSKTSDSTGTGSFTSSITGLSPGTTYHVRAYATNNVGTTYGSDLTFTTSYSSTVYVNKDVGICGGKTPCYTSIQEAINAAGKGSEILIAQGTYSESIILNTSKSLTLKGGWNSSFTTQTSNTTFIKAPKAPQGSLTLQMVTIRP